jgi:hypothetical protein
MKDIETVLGRVAALKSMVNVVDRSRIRAVMNGGAAGVQAIFNGGAPAHGPGSGRGADSLGTLGLDLPTANVMYSGLERMAQKIGRQPTLKTDMMPTRDNETARARAEKRGRIVRGWDEVSEMELQYPQIGRWLPGYGFNFHMVRDRNIGGQTIPVAQLRDPYDVFPGMWGVDQQPEDVAIVRHLSRKQVRAQYPEFEDVFHKAWNRRRQGHSIPILSSPGRSSWEGNPNNPVEVVEYMCHCGTHVCIPELDLMLALIPNPLDEATFYVQKRFSFDILQSHFAHVFGIMMMMGKMNILGLISTEEGTFRETNIIGDLKGSTYKKGRHAVNEFEPGTRIERLTSDQTQQVWQAINTLERQFRVVSGYPVSQDGQSPNSFATGQGIRELGIAADDNVREYQLVVKHGIQAVDRKRLAWEEKMHAAEKKKVYYYEGSNEAEETYVPAKDIGGDWRTRRVFGAMATFSESQQIVAGLQLMTAEVMDRRSMQENLDGLDNIELINERIDQDKARRSIMQALDARAAQDDPAALMALIEIDADPGKIREILKRLFTPEKPEASPAETMMGAPGGPGGLQMPGMPALGPGGPEAPPEPVQSVMSRMMGAGETGGVQTVATR